MELISQSLPWVHCVSFAQPQKPDAWQIGWFSGVHSEESSAEHWVHSPASGPVVLHAGSEKLGHIRGGGGVAVV
jgi:hypothetical protein